MVIELDRVVVMMMVVFVCFEFTSGFAAVDGRGSKEVSGMQISPNFCFVCVAGWALLLVGGYGGLKVGCSLDGGDGLNFILFDWSSVVVVREIESDADGEVIV